MTAQVLQEQSYDPFNRVAVIMSLHFSAKYWILHNSEWAVCLSVISTIENNKRLIVGFLHAINNTLVQYAQNSEYISKGALVTMA